MFCLTARWRDMSLGVAILATGCGRTAPERSKDVAPPTPVASPSVVTDASAPAAPTPVPSARTAAADLEVDPVAYLRAIVQVEETRGPSGRVDVPQELLHGEDRRVSMAVQLADASDEHLETAHDEAELAGWIRQGRLVELPPLGDGLVLYEIGTSVTLDPLVHFDVESGREVRLLGSVEEYEAEAARLSEESSKPGRSGARAREDLERLREWYEDSSRRQRLFDEHRELTSLAKDFGGHSYDLGDPADARRFQARLPSFLRPAAADVLKQVARAYHERFARPLPVSSLIRTERYQRRLSRLNPNATRVPVPPHTTGMAFDVSYKYMPAEEQNAVMQVLARIEHSGRVEALRERRNAFHVYTFERGVRPGPAQIAEFLQVVEDAHPGSAPRPARVEAKRPARRHPQPSRGRGPGAHR